MKGDTIKIRSSKRAVQVMLSGICVWMAAWAVLVWQLVNHRERALLFGGWMAVALLLLLVVFLVCRRLLTTVSVEQDRVSSYLFGKLRCEIPLDGQNYYVVMKSRSHDTIVISKEPFLYNVRARVLFNPFYRGVSLKKHIVLPFDQNIRNRLPIAEWNNMDTYDWDLYQELYDAAPLIVKRFTRSYSFPEKIILYMAVFLALIAPNFRTLLCMQDDRGAVIGTLVATLIAILLWRIFGISRRYYRLKISRYWDWIKTTEVQIRIRPGYYGGNCAEVFPKETVYYAKCRVTDGVTHAANYVMVSNDRLAIELAVARRMNLEKMDFQKIIPICYCKQSAGIIDLSRCELVE